jgi:hypothetical protein
MVHNNLDGIAGSLRSVISQANTDAAAGTSDTINFDSSLAGATITLTQGQLELKGAGGGGTITIDASNLSSPIAISGNNASRVIQVDAGTTAIFSRLTLEDGLRVPALGQPGAGTGSTSLPRYPWMVRWVFGT